MSPLVETHGVQNAIARIFRARIVICSVGFLSLVILSLPGFKSWLNDTFISVAFALYLLANRVSSECVCRLQPLAIADLADEDVYLRTRTKGGGATVASRSRRGVVVGVSGVLGKFATSLAPIFGVVLLSASRMQNGDYIGMSQMQGLPTDESQIRIMKGADFSDAGGGNGIAPSLDAGFVETHTRTHDTVVFRYALVLVPGTCVLIQRVS